MSLFDLRQAHSRANRFWRGGLITVGQRGFDVKGCGHEGLLGWMSHVGLGMLRFGRIHAIEWSPTGWGCRDSRELHRRMKSWWVI
jgi:hypothetical protein